MNLKRFLAISIIALTGAVSAFAQSGTEFKWYGFIRNYFTYDSREGVAGTGDLFYYLPKDEKIVDGVDVNQVNSFRFTSITSRIGLDVKGYQIADWAVSAKIEADFYAGVSGVSGTALLRLRQAYMGMSRGGLSLRLGQAWHPMAADMPDVISLSAGAPFNPFNRSPMVQAEYGFGNGLSLTGAAIWQMQYNSAGPEGQSANYIKYGCTPEFYLGVNYKADKFLVRAGADLLSIKPRRFGADGLKVNDRITTVSPYLYAQYIDGPLTLRAKTTFAEAGEHLNLNGGYGVVGLASDGRSLEYTPTRNSSSWISARYGTKFQGVLFAGYVRNFGASSDIVGDLYFSKNSFSNLTQLYRITPTVVYNLGKLQFALEFELTSAQYGDLASGATLAKENLHWVTNHRVQAMAKYTF